MYFALIQQAEDRKSCSCIRMESMKDCTCMEDIQGWDYTCTEGSRME